MSRYDWRVVEAPPPCGVAIAATPTLRRVVADNPGPMTGNGTNTWIVDHADGGCAVIDPGVADDAHLDAVQRALNGRPLTHIILTHTHHDHLDGAAPLSRRTGAPIHAWHRSAEPAFTPDVGLHDLDLVAGLRVLHTPGHATDHICLQTTDGVILTGDHVMGWSTTLIPPAPHGSVQMFLDSMERLLRCSPRLLLSAHGPVIEQPETCMRGLIEHRLSRHESIAALLLPSPRTPEQIVDAAYHRLRPGLRRAALLNLRAHLEKLRDDGRAVQAGDTWAHA
ncbi:MBL fold metallo-hydrolase [Gluconacetobacter entanii]|uniref:MBL fold metallo-hydrolase n=1 Tax=Gluconacetobacter entanii TaxID=108528 RepID=UPI001C93669C|nr:MBL fold metallo-hydrolase [Gluconacetobacter entanii]MBY4638586.1 MBL fold metallo-hydrolase [Gluconacetobacter entanii]MCW4581705.1 MBL fold metallo-hydrolase [Gluconacetobacter entanii]MCW4585177.1 MBL fold metallo-hydrolase [Gluconacetobacter entanii]MCW4588661.1 MBL fold metallo-hydrolase [Gluconacetobacter entanii]